MSVDTLRTKMEYVEQDVEKNTAKIDQIFNMILVVLGTVIVNLVSVIILILKVTL